MKQVKGPWGQVSNLAMRAAYLVGSSRASCRASCTSARPPTSCHPSIPALPPCIWHKHCSCRSGVKMCPSVAKLCKLDKAQKESKAHQTCPLMIAVMEWKGGEGGEFGRLWVPEDGPHPRQQQAGSPVEHLPGPQR